MRLKAELGERLALLEQWRRVIDSKTRDNIKKQMLLQRKLDLMRQWKKSDAGMVKSERSKAVRSVRVARSEAGAAGMPDKNMDMEAIRISHVDIDGKVVFLQAVNVDFPHEKKNNICFFLFKKISIGKKKNKNKL